MSTIKSSAENLTLNADEAAEDKQSAVDRNVEHLELMVAKDYWTDEDMTAVDGEHSASMYGSCGGSDGMDFKSAQEDTLNNK